ncbi:MAG: D-alanine--D-alanine ligase [Chitinophagales bacterium]
MLNKKNVAILTGGKSAELEISLASAQVVYNNLNKEIYNVFLVNISEIPWSVSQNGNNIAAIDLNDFSFSIENKKTNFDVVFMAIHGTPAEDGRVQGYFDILNIPYTCSSSLASAITFDKDICKKLLKDFPIKMAKSVLLNTKNRNKISITESLKLPVFVKPNKNGSSYGTFKVSKENELENAINKAFEYDDEVLVEEFIDGRELACGIFEHDNKLVPLPLTEIISENEFFDYEAKYQGKSKEITPAKIPDNISKEAQEKAKLIYRLLKLKGAVRIDYFLKETELYLLEINTIPGLSAESILPQEAKAAGYTLEQFFGIMIEEALNLG